MTTRLILNKYQSFSEIGAFKLRVDEVTVRVDYLK